MVSPRDQSHVQSYFSPVRKYENCEEHRHESNRKRLCQLGLAHSENCPYQRGPQSPERVLQFCPLFGKVRTQQWPHGATPHEQLWSNMEDLMKTTAFIQTTGLTIRGGTMFKCWRRRRRRRRRRNIWGLLEGLMEVMEFPPCIYLTSITINARKVHVALRELLTLDMRCASATSD